MTTDEIIEFLTKIENEIRTQAGRSHSRQDPNDTRFKLK